MALAAGAAWQWAPHAAHFKSRLLRNVCLKTGIQLATSAFGTASASASASASSSYWPLYSSPTPFGPADVHDLRPLVAAALPANRDAQRSQVV